VAGSVTSFGEGGDPSVGLLYATIRGAGHSVLSDRYVRNTANCIVIDHFSAFEFELVALFLTLPLNNGWQLVKTARNLNLGVSRNRFCDFLADPDSRSFSRFGAIILQFAVLI
jgi:hypothetical protein